ncbi:DUF927 domain-containing protein [Kushneria phosphatilytica]|uniref:DUF927 domain-containing protein n=1 Tax=Kushneria phosphatilytica TaxID=657387 RepID=A0A5C0ZTV2_9GAMM|nr:DUF927 domain-containing protein [Kushneria phosphatilytica]QEL09960.1 DUF927 domain-containing protein [Kushneria phosphatilytica]
MSDDPRTIPDALPDTEKLEGTGRTSGHDVASSRSLDERSEGTAGTSLVGEAIDPLTAPPPKPLRPRIKHRPAFMTHDDYITTCDGGTGRPGLYYHGLKRARGDSEATEYDQWLCSPIHVQALTSDERAENFGLMLRFRNPYGQWREWAMPMHLLKGNGEELRGELLAMGVRIDPGAHKLLHIWLSRREPRRRLIAAARVGWHSTPQGRAFVMPRQTLGADDVIFQSGHAVHDEFISRGDIPGWRSEVAALCSGNPLLVLAVSSALTGPLLSLTNRAGVGLHFVGDSSTGKSTLLQVAGSVWGGAGFIRTWRATGNGLEGIAAGLNDTCLILDEIGEASPHEVGNIIYALGNGTGKTRAARSGSARLAARWRVPLLSSGERSLVAHMAEGGKRSKAGQGVRLLDIPVSRQHGVFDTLHHLPDGRAFSDHLKGAVSRHHGLLGPEFIKHLLADEKSLAYLPDRLNDFSRMEGFRARDSLEGRAATSLALIGMAGEAATDYGLTGWEPGEALNAAMAAYANWKDFRGEGQTETRQILQAVESFITRHGDARFAGINNEPSVTGVSVVRERAGWWRDTLEGRVYLFTADGLHEALQGFDFKRGLTALDEAGWIVERDRDKRSKKIRVSGGLYNLYCIRPTQGVSDGHCRSV